MPSNGAGLHHHSIDPNATGASESLPAKEPGAPGRETHEREAAFARGEAKAGEPENTVCAPNVPGLRPDLLFTLLAENVRDYAVFLMDANGIIKCWDEGARLMKWWTRHQMEGAHLRVLYKDGGSEDGTAEAHLQTAADKGEYTGEGNRLRSDGSMFWAYTVLTALRDADGKLVGFAKVTRDFTARRAVEATLKKQAQAAPESQHILEEINRQKILVASISHELRSPLHAMMGYAALLEDETLGRERQRALIERLKRSGRHLLEIMNDVLLISRADAGALPVTGSVRRLGAAIQEAIAEVEQQAVARKVILTNSVSGAAADVPYFGDESRVRQIVVNLVANGIKFTESGGQVIISGGTSLSVTGVDLAGSGPWAYVKVEDQGRGIPPERLHAIFEPFQQSEAADRHRGTGLGLTISRQLAHLMGGDVTVHSEVGVGSSFTLWLPIAPSDPVPR